MVRRQRRDDGIPSASRHYLHHDRIDFGSMILNANLRSHCFHALQLHPMKANQTSTSVAATSARPLCRIVALFAITVTCGLAPRAAAVEITMPSQPIKTGSGANQTARYQNVATIDGTSVDLFAEITSQGNNDTNRLDMEDNDAVFQFLYGFGGTATIRWTFFESGTTTPVTIDDFTFTIDDLDDFSVRTEALSTADAVGYTVNDPTNVSVTVSGSTFTAMGSADQNSGRSGGSGQVPL